VKPDLINSPAPSMTATILVAIVIDAVVLGEDAAP
jgi:hypothetical protein